MPMPLRSCFILLLALFASGFGRDRVEASIRVPEHEAYICGVQYKTDLSETEPTQSPEPETLQPVARLSQFKSNARITPHGSGNRLEDWVCPKKPYGNLIVPATQALIFVHQFQLGLSQPIYELKNGFRWGHIDSLVKNYNLDSRKLSLIFTGGWTQGRNARWLAQARKNFDQLTQVLNDKQPANFIIFDWSDYSAYPFYPSAVSSVEHVANLLSGFIGELVDKHGFKASKFQIVSHSLSTHIAGLTGRILQYRGLGQLDQIIAIDPTGVCFHPGDDNFGDRYGLKPTDAKLVVATHFNMDGFGSRRPIGGVDVFVNGGKGQPETCRELSLEFNWQEKLLISLNLKDVKDHIISTELETNDPLPEDCHEIAYHCESMDKFRKGHCGSCGPQNKSCLMLGVLDNLYLKQNLSETKYLLGTQMFITTGYFKFCIHHYQIIARLRANTSATILSHFTQGDVLFQVDHHVELQPRHRFDTSQNDGYLFTELLRLSKNDIKFRKWVHVRIPKVVEFITSLEIHYMSNIFAEERAKRSAYYCPHEQKAMLILCSSKANVTSP